MPLTNPRDTIAMSPMSRLQIAAVAITIGLNALDGFDALSISFASPGIARERGINRAGLGFVLSMEMIGMGVGSIFLGGVADKIGRRRTLLGCLAVMTLGMLMTTRSKGVYDLSVCRVFTGLGIGGMLAAINAVASEFSNSRRRSLNVSLMAVGYPVGATGGAVLGLLSLRYSLKRLTMFVLVMSTLMVAVFGRGYATLTQLSLVCAIAGFFTNAGVVGLYGIMAQIFPTHVRATGTGFTIGLGRAGAMLAPIIAGYLFHAGYGLQFVAVAMGIGSLVAAVALGLLSFRNEAGGEPLDSQATAAA